MTRSPTLFIAGLLIAVANAAIIAVKIARDQGITLSVLALLCGVFLMWRNRPWAT